MRGLKQLGRQDDIQGDDQRAENGAEDRFTLAEVIARQDDREEIEIQKRQLLGNVVIDQDCRTQDEQDKQLLEVV